MRIYLAGAMTGKREHNFANFAKYRTLLRARGHVVHCPAEDSLARGFDPSTQPPIEVVKASMRRDFEAILRAEAIAVIPGWEKSKGVAVELAMAAAIGIPVLHADTLGNLENWEARQPAAVPVGESILDEASRLTAGARMQDYAPAAINHGRCAALWSTYLGKEVTADDVCLMMILLKIARGMHKVTRDTLVDIAGYARNVEQIGEFNAGSDTDTKP